MPKQMGWIDLFGFSVRVTGHLISPRKNNVLDHPFDAAAVGKKLGRQMIGIELQRTFPHLRLEFTAVRKPGQPGQGPGGIRVDFQGCFHELASLYPQLRQLCSGRPGPTCVPLHRSGQAGISADELRILLDGVPIVLDCQG